MFGRGGVCWYLCMCDELKVYRFGEHRILLSIFPSQLPSTFPVHFAGIQRAIDDYFFFLSSDSVRCMYISTSYERYESLSTFVSTTASRN